MMHEGDNVYGAVWPYLNYHEPRRRKGTIVPTAPLVNQARRDETAEMKKLGMTRKQYVKHQKKERRDARL